jgi:sugar phosphate isomerase/epimerase
MQLSCLPVSFFSDIIAGKMSVAAWARMGAEIGLDAIDLSILFVPDRNRATATALRREIEGAGMRVTMLTTYPDFTHPDARQRERELEQAEQATMLAADLGASFIRVTAGQAHPETKRAEGIAWAVEGLKRLVGKTRGLGVEPVYENHAKPGAWQYTDFSQPPEIFLEIAHKSANVGLRINFDTGNATAFAEDPVALLESVLPRVASIHAADTCARGALKPVLLGTGLAPFDQIFRRLHRAGWDGWICMEEASFQGRTGVESAARFVREKWAATADAS